MATDNVEETNSKKNHPENPQHIENNFSYRPLKKVFIIDPREYVVNKRLVLLDKEPFLTQIEIILL